MEPCTSPVTTGFNHVATGPRTSIAQSSSIGTREVLEELQRRVVDAGGEVGDITLLGGTTWSLFFRDPDGMELEVCAPK